MHCALAIELFDPRGFIIYVDTLNEAFHFANEQLRYGTFGFCALEYDVK